jgi:hypothetical protein
MVFTSVFEKDTSLLYVVSWEAKGKKCSNTNFRIQGLIEKQEFGFPRIVREMTMGGLTSTGCRKVEQRFLCAISVFSVAALKIIAPCRHTKTPAAICSGETN